MSGFGKPFREFTIEKVEKTQCLLPSKVPEIKDYDTCMVMMDQCKRSAAMKAQQRHDPRYVQYVNWFDSFAEQDKSVRTMDQNGNGEMEFFGGCKIFLMKDEKSRNEMWSSASDTLQDQLLRYHTNQNSKFGGQNPDPTVVCGFKNNKAQCL